VFCLYRRYRTVGIALAFPVPRAYHARNRVMAPVEAGVGAAVSLISILVLV